MCCSAPALPGPRTGTPTPSHTTGAKAYDYGIEGSDANDCLSAMCCAPCSVCQNDREMAARGEGLHGIFLSTPYQPPMIMRGIQ